MRKLETLNLSEKVTPTILMEMNSELIGMDFVQDPVDIIDEYHRIRRDLTGLFRFQVITFEDFDKLRTYAYEYMRDRLERWINNA